MAQQATQSLKEYGRGVAGGLLFSLPLLYTMEMWWIGFIADPKRLLIYMLVAFALLIGYNRFAGIHEDVSYRNVLTESTEEMGLGLLFATLVLWLIGQITPAMSPDEIVGKIVVESMIVAIGISVGTEQLGGPHGAGDEQGGHGEDGGGEQGDVSTEIGRQLVMGSCGAVLVAASAAPTQEIVMIGIEATPEKLIGLVLASMVIGAVILYFSEFRGTRRTRAPKGAIGMVGGLVVMYGVALAASAFMLWFFGRFDGLGVHMMVAETVVLAFPASLGASAGRLLISG